MLKNSSQSTMYIEVFGFSLLVIVARIIKNVVAVYFRTQSIKSGIQFSPSCFIVCSLLLCFCLKSDVFVSLLYSSREKGKEETNKTQNRNARTTQRNRLVYLYALVQEARDDGCSRYIYFFLHLVSSFYLLLFPLFSSFSLMGLFLSFIRLHLVSQSKKRKGLAIFHWFIISFLPAPNGVDDVRIATNSSIEWRGKKNLGRSSADRGALMSYEH